MEGYEIKWKFNLSRAPWWSGGQFEHLIRVVKADMFKVIEEGYLHWKDIAGTWPLGIVKETYLGKDNVVTAVRLKTTTESLQRAVQHLYPMKLRSDVNEKTRPLNHQTWQRCCCCSKSANWTGGKWKRLNDFAKRTRRIKLWYRYTSLWECITVIQRGE